MPILVFIVSLLFGNLLIAAEIQCKAKVTINDFVVTLNTDDLKMKVTTEDGHEYEGYTTRHFSPRLQQETYFLPSRSGWSLEFLRDLVGAKRDYLCLRDNECYHCKP